MSESTSKQEAVGYADSDPRQLGARLVHALYRLVKASQLHAESNQAVHQVVDFVAASSKAYLDRTGMKQVSVLFTRAAVFVNRQMLRASKETYQLALELGSIFEKMEVTEVTFTQEVTTQEITELGTLVAKFQSDGRRPARFDEGGWDGLRLRRVIGYAHGGDLSAPARAARTYAAALMIVRGFYDDLRTGNYELKQGIKRVAQKLVSQNEAGTRLLVTIAASPPADSDRAGMALASAILAVTIANQLTEDRTLLTSLASAALLFDAGRQRLVGYQSDSEPSARAQRVLNQDEEEKLAISSIVALTALGKLHTPSVTRSVIVHEAHALRGDSPLYGGRRSPALLSRILHVARTFAELRSPRGASAGIGIDDVVQILEGQATDNTGRAIVKLLVGALGIFPAGTMVELSTGEMGVVISTPELPIDFARPPVRIMYGERAQLLSDPFDVDLAERPPPGQRARVIVRTVDATDQQVKQMRAFVAQIAVARSRRSAAAEPVASSKPRAAPKPLARDDSDAPPDPKKAVTVPPKGRTDSGVMTPPSREVVATEQPSRSEISGKPATTDALLAAYLSEEAAGGGERSSRGSAPGADGSKRSGGLRWGDRPSATGANPISSSGSIPSSDSRGVPVGTDPPPSPPARLSTGTGPVSSRTNRAWGTGRGPVRNETPAPAPALFGSEDRGITGSPVSSFGSAGRDVTGAMDQPPVSIAMAPESVRPPAAPPSVPRVSQGRAAGAAAWAAPAKPVARTIEPASSGPAPAPESAPVSSGETAAPRRAKAGAQNWGAPKRDVKK